MNKNLLILGGGQYGSLVKEIAEEMNFFDKISFLDDKFCRQEEHSSKLFIGKLSDCKNYHNEYSYAIVAIGNAQTRKEWTEKIQEDGFEIPIIISVRAFVSNTSKIHKGCVIEPFACICANSVVSVGSFISCGAIINHNAIIGEYSHIENNSVIMSEATVLPYYTTNPCEIVRKKTNGTENISKRTPVGDGYTFENGV